MKELENYDDNDMPWDIKTVKIELGDQSDQWIECEIFSDKQLSITFKNVKMCGLNGEQTVDDMHMDIARRLRDFLNYAVPK